MAQNPTAAMIFAAGFGTRMGPLTADRPKPMVTLGGRPMIDYAVEIAQSAGAGKIVANLHYHGDILARHLAPAGVALSWEEPDILETGGGLRAALPLLGAGPVYTLNPDAAWRGPNPLRHLAPLWRPSEMDALLLLIPRTHARGYTGKGDFLPDQAGRLARGPGLVYSGAQIIKTDLLHGIKDKVFSLNKLWDVMGARGRLFGAAYPGEWCDVGTPEGLVRAEEMLGQADV
ncbi:MAG TPA: nucleotidyltransferase family protein [Aliiroseovarius sp.]|nr:nucleotidyltransferase family protein [Aliiroseovarius sp.]